MATTGSCNRLPFWTNRTGYWKTFCSAGRTRKYGISTQVTRKASSTHYYHSDSSAPGFVSVSRSEYVYDQQGRVARILKKESEIKSGIESAISSSESTFKYTETNDTLVSRLPVSEPNRSTVIDSIRWERNKQGQLVRHYRLYVMKMPQNPRLDTIRYFSHRFAYDKLGRRILAWYDLMYLGRFYIADGPDTIRYEYGRGNRPVREIHRYTTDMRNKREIEHRITGRILARNRPETYRQSFFEGMPY